MSKNPFVNGFTAFGYILIVVLVMDLGSQMEAQRNALIAPLAIISLFTLSATVIGYIFLLQPIQLFLSGSKKQAIKLFLQTVAVFGAITFILLIALFSGLFRN